MKQYERRYKFTASGSPHVERLAAPPRGTLYKLVIRNRAGTEFTARLYESQKAVSGNPADPDTWYPESYLVLPEQTSSGGIVQLLGVSYDYVTADGDSTNHDRSLYLWLSGAAGEDYEVTIGVVAPQLV